MNKLFFVLSFLFSLNALSYCPVWKQADGSIITCLHYGQRKVPLGYRKPYTHQDYLRDIEKDRQRYEEEKYKKQEIEKIHSDLAKLDAESFSFNESFKLEEGFNAVIASSDSKFSSRGESKYTPLNITEEDLAPMRKNLMKGLYELLVPHENACLVVPREGFRPSPEETYNFKISLRLDFHSTRAIASLAETYDYFSPNYAIVVFVMKDSLGKGDMELYCITDKKGFGVYALEMRRMLGSVFDKASN